MNTGTAEKEPAGTVAEKLPSSLRGATSAQTLPATHSPQVYVAKYDYEPFEDNQLQLKKGDQLFITDANLKEGWLLACSKDTGKVGYIPIIYVAKLNSLEAEE